jgi:acetyl esterase/lipase
MRRAALDIPLLAGCLALAGCMAGPPLDVTQPLGVLVERDIVYRVLPGGRELRLDLYRAHDARGLQPAVIWIFGGGWLFGGKDPCPVAPLATRGYVVASLEYRHAGEAPFPAQLRDCKAAVRFLRARGPSLGIDPGRIGVIGASAGGHLAALLGVTGDDPMPEDGEPPPAVPSDVRCVCAFFPPTDLLRLEETAGWRMRYAIRKLLGGTAASRPGEARAASPALLVSARSAPFLLIHGDRDDLVPLEQSGRLHDALRRAGVPSTLRVAWGRGHGNWILDSPEIQEEVEAFLARYLEEPMADGGRTVTSDGAQRRSRSRRTGTRPFAASPSRTRRTVSTTAPGSLPPSWRRMMEPGRMRSSTRRADLSGVERTSRPRASQPVTSRPSPAATPSRAWFVSPKGGR